MCDSPDPTNTIDIVKYISLGISLLALGITGTNIWFNWRERRNSKYSEIFAWPEIKRDDGNIVVANMQIINSTDYPIYIWQITASWGEGNTHQVGIGNTTQGVLPPGKHKFKFLNLEELPETDSEISVELSFTDSLGRLCKRSSAGKLIIN